jgi:sarcosine oxidase, subunit beta
VKRFIIIGGGITGCVAARELARLGHHVRLFEKRRVAAMASGWTLGGVRQSGRDPAELPLAKAAVAVWPRLAEALGQETGYHQRGNLRLARTAAEVPVIRALVEGQKRLGLDLVFLEGSTAVRHVAPAVSENVLAASFCPTDGFADPVATTTAFARAAERYGAAIEEGVGVQAIVARDGRVEGVETDHGFSAADAVVLTTGIHTPHLLKPLGFELPLDVASVPVVQTEPAPHVFDQVFGVANADCAGRQEPSGRFRFTSGLERYAGDPEHWSEASLQPSAESIAALRELVGAVLPAAAATPVARTWGGLIDLTPDHLPVIDAPMPGLVVAAGFSGHGFGIGPVTGRLAAELAIGERPFLSVNAFRLARFAADRRARQTLALHG